MATDIDMCSNALLLIGHSAISAFTDSGAGANAASNLFEETYHDTLAAFPWRFATGKVALSRLSSSPLDEWTYAFQLPADYLVLRKTYPNTAYRIYEDKLYTNVDAINIEYVFKPEDETLLPAYFVKVMEYRLASEFAIAVTSDANMASLYEQKYQAQMAKAKSIDSQANPNVPIVDAPFITARNA